MKLETNTASFRRARQSRDARFDGLFFVAVKTTGIYCRPICPANTPLERNVEYHDSALSAAQAGYRPCLRCRPDSAPHSCAWMGKQASFQRALNLINEGALQNSNIDVLASRLGISDRYLRDLFQENLGTSPKKYAIYQQCLFAKQLLHESSLPIVDIAYASGFNSVRRFNEAMQEQIGLAPRDIRRSDKVVASNLQLKLHYRPPYAWQHMLDFLKSRAIPGLEWVTENAYGRTIQHTDARGYFTVSQATEENYLKLNVVLNDYKQLNPITQRIRTMFDVDAPIEQIDSQLIALFPSSASYIQGLRIPGIWNNFEAGIRAILGQQVTVTQAMKLVTQVVDHLGEELLIEGFPATKLFPQPHAVANSDLAFLKMPGSRRDSLRTLAKHFLAARDPQILDDWLALKGIGPWTINYVKIRASKDPDIWLAGDAGLNKVLKSLQLAPNFENAKPWRSYLTFQLWNQL